MEDIDNGFKRIKKELQKLETLKLIIYIDDKATYENGTKVDFIAMLMEYGSDEFEVPYPSRPFWSSTFDSYYERYSKRFEKLVDGILAGETTAEQVLANLGRYVVRTIRDMIMQGTYAPLAESTAKAKGSTQPLIDTKLLYKSVKYKIE